METLNVKNSDLKLHWEAKFNDSSVICQYNKNNENSFKKVQENFGSLKYFSLYHVSKPLRIIVDIQKGLIYFNTINKIVDNDLNIEKKNIRLIYFRRNKIILNEKFQKKEYIITYFIGYQYIDKNGKNKKVLLQINQEGNIIIGDL